MHELIKGVDAIREAQGPNPGLSDAGGDEEEPAKEMRMSGQWSMRKLHKENICFQDHEMKPHVGLCTLVESLLKFVSLYPPLVHTLCLCLLTLFSELKFTL